MSTASKCPHCHTPLPDFSPWEKPRCPNCDRRVSRGIKYQADNHSSIKAFFLSKPLLFWPFALSGIFYLVTDKGFSLVISFLVSLLLSLPAWFTVQNRQLRAKIQDDNPWVKSPVALRYLYRKAQLRRCLRSIAKLLIYCVCLLGILLMIRLSSDEPHTPSRVEDAFLGLLTFCLLTLAAFAVSAVRRWLLLLLTPKPNMAEI